MKYSESTILKSLNTMYPQFTNVEKKIADFFIEYDDLEELSAKTLSEKIFVSEASLSRFAKKCGYKGFREFVFEYEKGISKYNKKESSNLVINIYQDLLDNCNQFINEEQIKKISQYLGTAKKIVIFGMGSSGVAADEIHLRFMRLGLNVEAVHDSHRIKMLSSLSDNQTLIIAISVSGTTKEVLQGISIAKSNGAKIVLITSNESIYLSEFCDEIMLVPTIQELEARDCISPQFSILVMMDILYMNFINIEHYYQNKKNTFNALYKADWENDI